MICYKVDKENGVVEAYFRNESLRLEGLALLRHELSSYVRTKYVDLAGDYFEVVASHSIGAIINDFTRGFVERSARGIAKCHPSDAFDEEIGKQIAKDRLKRKYNNIFSNISEFVMDDLYDLINRARDRFSHHRRIGL